MVGEGEEERRKEGIGLFIRLVPEEEEGRLPLHQPRSCPSVPSQAKPESSDDEFTVWTGE